MRKPIAAANWKMNGDFALVEAFAKHAWPQGNVEKIFGLPAIYISKAHELGLEILAETSVRTPLARIPVKSPPRC